MWTALIPYAVLFMVIETVTRITLGVRAWYEVGMSVGDSLLALAVGTWFDGVVLGFFLIPCALHHVCMPRGGRGGRVDRLLHHTLRSMMLFVLLFTSIAEHIFWSEFSTRLNFIAIDYLVYTHEVIGNIVESYPLGWLLTGIAIASGILTWVSLRWWPIPHQDPATTPSSLHTAHHSWVRRRLVPLVVLIMITSGVNGMTRLEWTQFSDNTLTGELAANGIYTLFHAFWHNEIDYSEFYPTLDPSQVRARIRQLLQRDAQGIRWVHGQTREHRYHVMIVVMESMSAEYMQSFGNTKGLTPHLDRLAQEGILWRNLYATGTRTIRGLEAITLSVPPTPGQSIVRRPGNEGLYSLGFVFQDRGYDTRFLYGGYGYFDNMNAFFASNGFDVVDRAQMDPNEIHFANVWGVADDDLFSRAIREADASYAQHRPFMQVIMTTSNHRPFTFPDGRIDIPSHSGRFGGVKYADYSIGALIAEARTRPWFDDTIFVLVADHTAGVAGKAELNPRKHHIPMIFYAPKILAPKSIDRLASQIDLAPTLLGVLGWSYPSKFYGRDLLHPEPQPERTFISNYQKVGMAQEGVLTVLSPKRQITQQSWPEHPTDAESKIEESPHTIVPTKASQDLIDQTITYYQSASEWRTEHRRIPINPWQTSVEAP